MSKFTIEIETDNPDAREVLYGVCESQLIAVDTDNDGTHHDAWISVMQEDLPMPEALVYAVELDGEENNRA